MRYRRPIERTLRDGARNPFGLAAVSLAVSLALVPLGVTVLVGTTAAVIGGLWATSLSLGVVLVAAFGLTGTIAERGVHVPTRRFLEGVDWREGLALGVATFLVGLPVVLAVALATAGRVPPAAVGAAASLPALWYLWVGLSVPELGEGAGLMAALRAGGRRLVESPPGAAWLLLWSAVFAAVAGLLVVVVVLLLPGTLALLAANVARSVDGDDGDGDGNGNGVDNGDDAAPGGAPESA